MEDVSPNRKKRKGSSRQKKEHNKKKFKDNCYNCEKISHRVSDYRISKEIRNKSDKHGGRNRQNWNFMCYTHWMQSEKKLKEWWFDSRVTQLVCALKEAFATYTPADSREKLFMKNTTTIKVEESAKILLKMTSGKMLTLNSVLHVSTIRKNSVSTALLIKIKFKCVFISEKVVISKNEMYVGKGYLNKGLFKFNVIVVDNTNKNQASFYLLDSNNLWHERICQLLNLVKID